MNMAYEMDIDKAEAILRTEIGSLKLITYHLKSLEEIYYYLLKETLTCF